MPGSVQGNFLSLGREHVLKVDEITSGLQQDDRLKKDIYF